MSLHEPATGPPKEPQIFEFTKRKRWADLLVTELSEAIIFVLSASCQVWYCGTAVSDLLGWRDDELVDGDLLELMNADDRASFREQFNHSIDTRCELLAYVRLQCKNKFHVRSDYSSSPREILFEIVGHPHFLPEGDEFKCFFAMAKPYPSRNSAMLNTFLELKMENERLQQRLADLRAHRNSQTTPEPGTVKQPHPLYPGQPLPATQRATDQYYSSTGGCFDSGSAAAAAPTSAAAAGDDDVTEGPRKKFKKTQSGDQHCCVTCGRTDSPEWRKGPNGPKTLCNACGLRWAKSVRTKEGGEGEGEASSVVF